MYLLDLPTKLDKYREENNKQPQLDGSLCNKKNFKTRSVYSKPDLNKI